MLEKKKSAAAVSISHKMIEPPIIERQDEKVRKFHKKSITFEILFVFLTKNDRLMKKCNNSKNWKKNVLPFHVVYE